MGIKKTVTIIIFLFALLFTSYAIATDKKMMIGASGNLFLTPQVKLSGGNLNQKTVMDFSGGATFIFDYYVWDYIAVGGNLDVIAWNYQNLSEPLVMVSIDPTIKGLYAFGKNRELEVYFKFGVGYSAFVPQWYGGDTAHGWNVKLLPGFMYTIGNSFALFAELGGVIAGFKEFDDSGFAVVSYNQLLSSFVMNLGVGYRF